jgi:quercetin dioxygenase-like cupin family protein
MNQPRDVLTLETLGSGVFDPRDWSRFSSEHASVAMMYTGDDDCSNIVVWSLAPGQENSTHMHPESAHFIVALEGSGECLRGDGKTSDPIDAGQVLIVPRNVVHGIRNRGETPFSYVAFSTVGYQRDAIGEQAASNIGGH